MRLTRTAGLMCVYLAVTAAVARGIDPATQVTSEPTTKLRDMDVDRPDHTNTPHTIDAGHLQIETGFVDYVFNRDKYKSDNQRTDTFAVGQETLRLGVLDDLELDAGINLYNFTRSTDFGTGKSTRQNGVGDLLLGGTLNLWGNDGSDDVWATGFAIQPLMKLPTARRYIGNGRFEAYLGFPFLINLPAGFHLGLQTTVSSERNTSNTGNVVGWQNSAAIDRVVFADLDVYLEYWSHVTTERHREAQQTVDVGVTYPLNDAVVLDTGVNVGLNKASNSFEWLVGFSVRF